MRELVFVKQMALVHVGVVKTPDILVQVADFFLKMAEVTWSVVSGIYDNRLIVVFRNTGFRCNAGKLARRLSGEVGSAGGHKDSARAEVPLANIECGSGNRDDCRQYVLKRIRSASG
jgi:nanoRNase/pAp phosphatase (c-di-AMP/oligoRNAs hydrolase)